MFWTNFLGRLYGNNKSHRTYGQPLSQTTEHCKGNENVRESNKESDRPQNSFPESSLSTNKGYNLTTSVLTTFQSN